MMKSCSDIGRDSMPGVNVVIGVRERKKKEPTPRLKEEKSLRLCY